MKTIYDLLEIQADQFKDKIAILGVDGINLSYKQLLLQAQYTHRVLQSLGIKQNEPVAIVLPNGPLMALTFLSVSSGAASAPLNPSYTAEEYKFYLSDLNAKAVVIEEETDNPVISIAHNLKIPIIRICQNLKNTEVLFSLSYKTQQNTQLEINKAPKQTDISLILHTSGTTSRPKMVPLTHKNLLSSANNISQTLQLTSEDRCLNIMPLFHIHGLMAGLLASLTAGGSVICSPGFYAPRFFNWVDELKPTWYTAVPTMHQSILNRAKENLEIIKKSKIRFVRSSSASLPTKVMREIEAAFNSPMIESYGMTEAAHQMASNPLPAGMRKPGSVGLPAGPEIAIMHEDKPTLLSNGDKGEIVIRGANVTLGYINNPEANQKSFTEGWFRTGDQGYLDEDGYLFITGRLKEVINRGGENISPNEIDEVLLTHPGIFQAVTFGIPDEHLGEDIAAAVTLKDNTITTSEIKRFLSKKLSIQKIPTIIVIVDEIPKGPSGKLQRIGLAEKLNLVSSPQSRSLDRKINQQPRNEIEIKIHQTWANILGIEKFSIFDEFRVVGGDSMLATLVHLELEKTFNIAIPLIDLFAARTVAEQADLIKNLTG